MDTKKMKRTSILISLMLMVAFTLTTTSCYKEPDLSGYMTKEEWEAWQREHDQSGYMTHDEFDEWVRNHPDDTVSINLIKVKDFSITFPAVDNEYESTVDYYGLHGIIQPDDVLLVYFSTILGWSLLPWEAGNRSYIYGLDGYKLTFRSGSALHVTFTRPAETWNVKAIIIPATIYTSKCKQGVNHNNYAEVARAYGLTDAAIE